MTAKLTAERLRTMTLRRQFPSIASRGQGAVVRTYERLGPVQTQVPRAAHLALASRLPGVTRDTITGAFESYQVVKASNIRGTVHTSTQRQHALLRAVAHRPRQLLLANHLALREVTTEAVMKEIERFATDSWQPRADIVAHMGAWLAARDPVQSREAVRRETLSDSLLWGHPSLIRRPPDQRWETRTDTLHRAADAVFEAARPTATEAMGEVVLTHLNSYGPATRRDIAWWAGVGLTPVDQALKALGEQVVRLLGPDGRTYLDVAEPPRGGTTDPGLRLLPEFDGLFLGYEGPGRTRFVDSAGLTRLWAKVNGLFAPSVLDDGRVVASWKTITKGRRHDIEVTMLPGCARITVDRFAAPVAAVEAALGIAITDVRVRHGIS